MPTKQNDFKILANLIKSQAESTETKLTGVIKSQETRLTGLIGSQETKLTGLIKSQAESTETKLTKLIKTEAENTEVKLTKLIKTEAENTEVKLTKLIKTEAGKTKKEFKTALTYSVAKLQDDLDQKFEDNRRLLVDEMQNFQDAIITEVKAIKQESAVNSSHRNILSDHEVRLSKVERHLFTN